MEKSCIKNNQIDEPNPSMDGLQSERNELGQIVNVQINRKIDKNFLFLSITKFIHLEEQECSVKSKSVQHKEYIMLR